MFKSIRDWLKSKTLTKNTLLDTSLKIYLDDGTGPVVVNIISVPSSFESGIVFLHRFETLEISSGQYYVAPETGYYHWTVYYESGKFKLSVDNRHIRVTTEYKPFKEFKTNLAIL